jgi:hypothetical protein
MHRFLLILALIALIFAPSRLLRAQEGDHDLSVGGPPRDANAELWSRNILRIYSNFCAREVDRGFEAMDGSHALGLLKNAVKAQGGPASPQLTAPHLNDQGDLVFLVHDETGLANHSGRLFVSPKGPRVYYSAFGESQDASPGTLTQRVIQNGRLFERLQLLHRAGRTVGDEEKAVMEAAKADVRALLGLAPAGEVSLVAQRKPHPPGFLVTLDGQSVGILRFVAKKTDSISVVPLRTRR